MGFADSWHVALGAVRRPLSYFGDPEQRLFLPFLLGALGVAVLALLAHRRLTLRALRGLFTPRVWLHQSSLLDYKLLFAKPVIHALFFAPALLSSYALALWTVGRLDAWRGVPGPTALPGWQLRGLYTLVLFVAWDASRFLVHFLAHKVPVLWELHKVHHSAEVMTPFTLYRSHPLESLLFKVRGILVTGLLTGLFFHLFRLSAVQYDFLGVNAVGFVLNLLGGNLRHSHVWLRYPRWLERILISPAQHQLHHSAVMEQCHSNYGVWLSCWDALLGSLRFSDEGRPRRFGLPRRELNHSPHGLASALFAPMWAGARALVPRRWRRTEPAPAQESPAETR